jgi:hypothetical protein
LPVDRLGNSAQRPSVEPCEVDPLAHRRREPISRVTAEPARLGSAAATIRAAFEQGGELSAAIELRRLFPGITDNTKARECARAIAGWLPPTLPVKRRMARPRA